MQCLLNSCFQVPLTHVQINLYSLSSTMTYRLRIGDVVARTGVAEATLRMWERRHGFPAPQRTESGHRRYNQEQVEDVERVMAGRQAGLSLKAAIERAQRPHIAPTDSLFATLRRDRPELEVRLIPKPVLIVLSHAIEDEILAAARPQALFACFQRQRFYRQAKARWRELARGALAAAVFADFSYPRAPRDGPAEVPLEQTRPLAREWAIVCDGPEAGVCLAGREPPGSTTESPTARRVFELVWSVDPQVVRDAARICAGMAGNAAEPAAELLAGEAPPAGRAQLRLATNIVNRTLAALA